MSTATTANRLSRRRTATVAVIAAAAVALAGCSSSSDEDTNVESFTIGIGTAPNSLDLARHFDANTMGYMSLFTEPLERLSGDGSLTPNLAEKVTQPSPQKIVYTIRSGVEFSNGKDLTAADVAWTIDHVTDASGGAQTASLTASVEGAKVTGDNEVTVSLSRPDPSARASLALVALVQDSEFAKANESELGQPSAVPVGTGPYVVTSSTAEAVELERNETYWGEDPLPEAITISFLGSDDTAQLAMGSGSVNGMVVGNPVTLPQYESVSGVTTYSTPALMSHYWSLDTTSKPFDDPHARRAVAHAVDRSGLMEAAFGDSASLLTALIPRDLLTPIASKAEVDDFLAELEPVEFDLDAARSELAQSRYPDGFELEVPVMAGSWSELTALNLQENLESLGITITTKSVTPQQWTEMVFSHDTAEMFPMSFSAAIPDPGLLRRVVSEEARTEPGGYNFADWAPADLQAPASSLQQATDDKVRFKAATAILTRISEEVPYIPLYQPDYTVVLGEGFTFTEAPTVIEMASGLWIQRLRGS